jgi:dipeptidyl aminopeptidase/acylaminoacyl peptidase
MVALIAGLGLTACARRVGRIAAPAEPGLKTRSFSFQITSGKDRFQIEGFSMRPRRPGRLPTLLILNGDRGDARQCIDSTRGFARLGLEVACISIPGYGKSSGPGRFVGPQAVLAARHALDLLAASPEVDPSRIAVWGMADGAVAAGLLMDSDTRPRALILQSGAYDPLTLWPQASLRTKLRILRQVWPSRQALTRRSVIAHLPPRLDCKVLILHGERDTRAPVAQAKDLAANLRTRGAFVESYYFPRGSDELGASVDGPLRSFLETNLLSSQAAS